MGQPTLPERLTEQFYAWELRGRGYEEFPRPVELEPPFRPFPGYFLPPTKDDGHRPTLMSRLFAPPRRKTTRPEVEEPEPIPFETEEPLRESVVSLPPDKMVSVESGERFLLALAGAELPLAFEILGLPERLETRMVSRAPDTSLLTNELRAFFPEVSIGEEEDGLRSMWTRDKGETILLHFGLAREFMLPVNWTPNFPPLSTLKIPPSG